MLNDILRVLRVSNTDHGHRYWAYKNAWSIDGLPGMNRGTVAAKKYSVAPSK
jgi:hypothetical protein